MNPRLMILTVLFGALVSMASASAAAQVRDDPTPLLRREADIAITTPGLHRVPLSADVLRDASPGLADVRIIDVDGQEVPWLVAADVRPRPPAESVPLTPLEVTQERRRRVYDRFGRHETYLLELPPAPVGTDGWDLQIDAAAPHFTRQYTVSEVRRTGATGSFRSGTVFRFPSPLREKRRIPLAAPNGTFLVTLDGDDGGWLSPTFTAVATRPVSDAPNLALPLPTATTEHADGRTTLRVARPRGVIPSSILIASTSTTFHRRVEIYDAGFGSERRSLGVGTAFRITDPIGEEHLEIAISPARGDTLEIHIHDQDGPPLSDLAVTGVVRAPILVADLPRGASLRFGGGRLRPPTYDLTHLGTSELGRRLIEADLPLAEVSDSRPNPAFDSAPALAWAMRPGTDVDRYRFRHVRTVFLDPSPEGLSRIRLSAADLGALSASRTDLRVVDVEDRQWPFLMEADAGIDEVAMLPEALPVRGGTAHRATLPNGPVPLHALRVQTSAPFVDRDYLLYASIGEAEEVVVARGRLTRRPDADEQIRIDLGDVRGEHLRLVVRDGSDAPLTSVELIAEIAVPDLYVAAPAGDYTVLLGADDVDAPRYEIQRARSVILSVSPDEAYPRPLTPNPAYVPPRRSLHLEDWALWAVLLLAVLLLSLLTLRSLRSESPSPEDDGAEDPGPDPIPGDPHSA